MTPQREAICTYLAQTDRHPTPYQVYEDLSVTHPEISRATVYNTLNTLQQLGAIVELSFGADHTHYDTNPEPHINLICLRCHRSCDYHGPTAVGRVDRTYLYRNRFSSRCRPDRPGRFLRRMPGAAARRDPGALATRGVIDFFSFFMFNSYLKAGKHDHPNRQSRPHPPHARQRTSLAHAGVLARELRIHPGGITLVALLTGWIGGEVTHTLPAMGGHDSAR